MGENTAIEWATNTFNPWEGCTKVGPGCDHCYAENRNARFGGGTSPNWGAGAPRRRTSVSNWQQPLKWNREAAASGVRPRVFCASLADWLCDLLNLIRQTPNLDWLLLTKRIGNWRIRLDLALIASESRPHDEDLSYWIGYWLSGAVIPHNVWLGATVVNQIEADRDIPRLLKVPARIRFLSMEPLLGPVDFKEEWLPRICPGRYLAVMHGMKIQGIDWIIAGGESGPSARIAKVEWARSLRDQCAAAGVPFLWKQWGDWAPYDRGRTDSRLLARPGATDAPPQRFGKKLAGRLLDGQEHNGFPA